ncbi:MAG: hypothetical protein WD334_10445, partial [Chitinophagales bacterium]
MNNPLLNYCKSSFKGFYQLPKQLFSVLLPVIAFVMLLPLSADAQAWPGANLRSTASPLCNSNRSVNTIGPGDYVQFNVVNT